MKAFLINPFDRTITEVEHNGNYRQIYTFIDCETFDVVTLHKGDVIYVDDEGLLKDDMSKQAFFALPSVYPESAYAGKGLMLGSDDVGNSTSPHMTLEEVTKLVRFMTVLEAYVALDV